MDNPQTQPARVVLVVEDEFLVREYAAGILADSGFEVVQARDAYEALATLEIRSDIEVLFTDVNMPGQLDGFGLSREVARRWPHVSRLVTSGLVNRAEARSKTDDVFIAKPYQPEDVVENIRDLLQRRH